MFNLFFIFKLSYFTLLLIFSVVSLTLIQHGVYLLKKLIFIGFLSLLDSNDT
jgi:hypothetical protein